LTLARHNSGGTSASHGTSGHGSPCRVAAAPRNLGEHTGAVMDARALPHAPAARARGAAPAERRPRHEPRALEGSRNAAGDAGGARGPPGCEQRHGEALEGFRNAAADTAGTGTGPRVQRHGGACGACRGGPSAQLASAPPAAADRLRGAVSPNVHRESRDPPLKNGRDTRGRSRSARYAQNQAPTLNKSPGGPAAFLEIFPAWTTAEQGPKCSRFGNGNRGASPKAWRGNHGPRRGRPLGALATLAQDTVPAAPCRLLPVPTAPLRHFWKPHAFRAVCKTSLLFSARSPGRRATTSATARVPQFTLPLTSLTGQRNDLPCQSRGTPCYSPT
jgi:hypothetical protein